MNENFDIFSKEAFSVALDSDLGIKNNEKPVAKDAFSVAIESLLMGGRLVSFFSLSKPREE